MLLGAGRGVLLLREGQICSVLPICSHMPAAPRPWHSAARSLLLLRFPCRHLRDQLMDEERTDALIHEHNGLYVDFSRQNINETTMQVRSWGRGHRGQGLLLLTLLLAWRRRQLWLAMLLLQRLHRGT